MRLYDGYNTSFINDIMAEQPLLNQNQDSSSKTTSSGSSTGIVNNNGRREWVPKNLPGNTFFQEKTCHN